MDNQTDIAKVQKELICSDAFEKALTNGSEKNIEIDGTLKNRSKSNYEIFYDLMLRSRTDIQSIADKKKKHRTSEENEKFAKFKKETSIKYKQVRELIFVDKNSDDKEDGDNPNISKKLLKIVDNLANVIQLLKYIGHNELENELSKRGISLNYQILENISDSFANEAIHQSMIEVFDTACNIQQEISDKKREITTSIFALEVPQDLQYDKESNPTGIKPSDFNKLVQIQSKKIKALSDDAKDKLDKQVTTEAENKHYDSIRNEVLREKYMSLMEDAED